MICTACQRVIADGSNFCYNCGAKQPNAGPAQAAPAPHGQNKKLMRSSRDKKLGGVCAGLLVYLILWIVLPLEPQYVQVVTQTPVAP
jgi:PspC domain